MKRQCLNENKFIGAPKWNHSRSIQQEVKPSSAALSSFRSWERDIAEKLGWYQSELEENKDSEGPKRSFGNFHGSFGLGELAKKGILGEMTEKWDKSFFGQPGVRAGEERSDPGKILAAEKCIYCSWVCDLIYIKAPVQLGKGGALLAGWEKVMT